MRLVGLISGGKDSIYNMLQCIAAGHEIVAVANIEPPRKRHDIDSYMYQTVGHEVLSLVSGALGLPVYRQKTNGIAICKEKIYVETPHDEVEDLYTLLSKVKGEMHVEGVSVGAIASDYQRTRVENVCSRLNLKSFAYLWKRDQDELLTEMIDAEIDAIIIKVATLGLRPESHLGMSIKDLQPVLRELNNKFGVNMCGEGGEYETLTIDSPLNQRKIEILQSETVIQSDDAFAPVGYLLIKNANLIPKLWDNSDAVPSVSSRVEYIRSITRSPLYYVHDCLDDLASKLFIDKQSKSFLHSPEVLPFPFSTSEKKESFVESKTALTEYWKNKSASLTIPAPPVSHGSHVVTFSPSSVLPIDTSGIQLNHSTGWCCIGNVTAPSLKEGLGLVQKHFDRFQYEMRDIVSITLYMRDITEWAKLNKIYSRTVPNHCPPVRSCVAVPLTSDIGVSLTVVAHRLVSKTQKVVHHTQHTVDKDIIHVQSISHWAPANIGPYSQCVRIGEIVYVAGQIPLIPGTMELLNRPILQQCRLTLRHIYRIIKAANESYTMANVMYGICYVVSEESAEDMVALWSYITQNEHAVIAVVVVSSLPKNAQLEIQVLATGYSHPQVSSSTEVIGDEFLVKCKRCLYADHQTSAVVCVVTFPKKGGKKEKSLRTITQENVMAVMKYSLQYLRNDIVASGTPLCILNLFYRANDSALASIINDCIKSAREFKVVASCIPVVALSEPEMLLTVTGVCH